MAMRNLKTKTLITRARQHVTHWVTVQTCHRRKERLPCAKGSQSDRFGSKFVNCTNLMPSHTSYPGLLSPSNLLSSYELVCSTRWGHHMESLSLWEVQRFSLLLEQNNTWKQTNKSAGGYWGSLCSAGFQQKRHQVSQRKHMELYCTV